MVGTVLRGGPALRTPAVQVAGAVLREKLRTVRRHERGVRAADLDAVHDMRVGTKRLRESMRLFRPVLPRARAKRYLRTIDRLNDTLGQARDPDVLLVALADLEQVCACPGRLSSVTERLRTQRVEAQANVVACLDGLEQSRFWRRFRRFTDRLRETSERTTVWRLAQEVVPDRLMRALELEPAARRPDAPEALHRLRITVKRVKYAIEPFRALFDGALDPAYVLISDLQDALGDTHDADVLLGLLQPVADTATEDAAAVACCVEVIHKRRGARFQDALMLLDEMRERDVAHLLLDPLDH